MITQPDLPVFNNAFQGCDRHVAPLLFLEHD